MTYMLVLFSSFNTTPSNNLLFILWLWQLSSVSPFFLTHCTTIYSDAAVQKVFAVDQMSPLLAVLHYYLVQGLLSYLFLSFSRTAPPNTHNCTCVTCLSWEQDSVQNDSCVQNVETWFTTHKQRHSHLYIMMQVVNNFITGIFAPLCFLFWWCCLLTL